MSRRLRLFPVLLSLAMALAACGDTTDPVEESAAASTESPDTVRVVATTSVLGDIVATVLEDTGAEVEVLMETGVDPHTYAPSARDGVTLREADLVVAVGLGLEEQLEDVLAAAEEDGAQVLRVGELVDPIEAGAAHDEAHADEAHADEAHADDEHADDEHSDGEHDDGEKAEDEHADEDGHAHEGGLDPHVWLDPLRVGRIAEEVAIAFGAVVPDEAATVAASADAYVERMADLDEELQSIFGELPADRRRLVTDHDSLAYLAARYDLEVIATVVPGTTTAVDVSAAAFTELVEILEETGVPAIFAETSSSDRLAQALAAEVGEVEVVELYTGALGAPGSGAETVEGMLRSDARRIVDALG